MNTRSMGTSHHPGAACYISVILVLLILASISHPVQAASQATVFRSPAAVLRSPATVLRSPLPAAARISLATDSDLQFGYGARLDLAGQHPEMALELAAGLGLDWISIEFDWARHTPTPETTPDLQPLSAALQRAANLNIGVLLILSNPPAWAQTAQGPDSHSASALATSLASLQPAAVLAIELFPAANTYQGWQAAPDPTAYLALLKETGQALWAGGLQTQVIASLAPLSPDHNAADMDDLKFLQSLYQNGAQPYLSVIGLRYPSLVGAPLDPPDQGTTLVLRHYEALRAVMLQNNHAGGQIWITSFSWPTEGEAPTSSAQEQAQWLKQALQLLKAQLFIGAAFFNQLNPPESSLWTANSSSLLLPDLSLHPACQELMDLTGATSTWPPGGSPPQPPAQTIEIGSPATGAEAHLKSLTTKITRKGLGASTVST